MKKFFSFLLGLTVLASSASAVRINVPSGQPTIQAGINTASPGDTVLVQPGRYLENIDFKGKDIVVGSLFLATKDTTYISNTIIDGQNNDVVAVFKNSETNKAELCGFTLTNGHSTAGIGNPYGNNGGGIYCLNSSPYLHHLIVDGNFSFLQGGGMYLENSNSVIEYCVIKNNRGVIGAGGIELLNGNYEIKNCIIDNNTGIGGGIHCNHSTVLINKVLLTSNNDEAFRIDHSHINIINCAIVKHYSFVCKIFNSYVNIINSIFWNDIPQIIISNGHPELPISHVRIAFSDIRGGRDHIIVHSDSLYYENNNINAEPLFKNIENSDYSLSINSPCIDSGTAYYKISDVILLNLKDGDYHGNSPDIGCFESDYSTIVNDYEIKEKIELSNYPNPFNTTTIIKFSLLKQCHIHLSVYTITGKKIADLIDNNLPLGEYHTQWNGTDKSRNKTSSGVYIIQLNIGKRSISNRVVFMK